MGISLKIYNSTGKLHRQKEYLSNSTSRLSLKMQEIIYLFIYLIHINNRVSLDVFELPQLILYVFIVNAIDLHYAQICVSNMQPS
jgi:hypothetical protein